MVFTRSSCLPGKSILLRDDASPLIAEDSPTTRMVKSESFAASTALLKPASLSQTGSQPGSNLTVLFGYFARRASTTVIGFSGLLSPAQLLFISLLLSASEPITAIFSTFLLIGRVWFSFLNNTKERSAARFAASRLACLKTSRFSSSSSANGWSKRPSRYLTRKILRTESSIVAIEIFFCFSSSSPCLL